MNCFDCAALGDHVDAVAICADCGAAVCHDHAHVTARWLIRTMVINRVVAVDRPRVPSAAVSARPPAMPRCFAAGADMEDLRQALTEAISHYPNPEK